MQTDPTRTVAELKQHRTLTGNENGAQRIACTDTWLKAHDQKYRSFFDRLLNVRSRDAVNIFAVMLSAPD